METRQVKGALKAMPIKTDRRDAEGIARLLHLGWFRPVHCKSVSAQEVRAVLTARKAVQQGFITLEMSLPGSRLSTVDARSTSGRTPQPAAAWAARFLLRIMLIFPEPRPPPKK
jgi:transposase